MIVTICPAPCGTTAQPLPIPPPAWPGTGGGGGGTVGPMGPAGPAGPMGATGPMGPPGPAGADGISPPAGPELTRATEYLLSLESTAPPAPGEVRINNPGNQTAASIMWIAHVNAVGEDCANIFRMLTSSSKVFVQDVNSSDAYQIYRLTGNPVDDQTGKYITLSLAWLSGGAAVPTGGNCFIGT